MAITRIKSNSLHPEAIKFLRAARTTKSQLAAISKEMKDMDGSSQDIHADIHDKVTVDKAKFSRAKEGGWNPFKQKLTGGAEFRAEGDAKAIHLQGSGASYLYEELSDGSKLWAAPNHEPGYNHGHTAFLESPDGTLFMEPLTPQFHVETTVERLKEAQSTNSPSDRDVSLLAPNPTLSEELCQLENARIRELGSIDAWIWSSDS